MQEAQKRLQLKTIEGMDTRPTTDRIKETLFNMISTDLADCRFLDLFSGSGAIGIEALSRGADIAYFVENHPKAADCIKQNLRHTRLEERAVLMRMDVLSALRKLEGEDSFDIIFMDPPYHIGAERGVFDFLKHSGLVNENTLINCGGVFRYRFFLDGRSWISCDERKKNIRQTAIFLSKEIEFFGRT